MKFALMRQRSNASPKVRIGTLEWDGKEYTWTYDEIDNPDGLWEGFYSVPGLERGEVSRSESLFWYFADRIPSRRRKDFPKILAMFGLNTYDERSFISASGLRMGIDSDELIEVD